MRRYTALFMEQQIGVNYLTQMAGDAGIACFDAVDDDAALAYMAEHLSRRMSLCVRAELTSMAIVPDASASGGRRMVDDCLENPYFQEMYVKYNAKTKNLDVDFECTRTVMMTRPVAPPKLV